MPAPATAIELIDLVRKSGICKPDALTKVVPDPSRLNPDPIKTAALLVRQGLMTAFQAKLLLAGRYRGFRMGAYIIREQIGQGGMGTVYLAEHETLRRRVAIKVLGAAAGMNKLSVERFLREARAAAALDHPNIVRIFDVGMQGDVHYLVLEHVDGQTLDKLVEIGGPISCSRAVEMITQAAAGLQHAYEKGFVHRDIKPGNLMLAKDGTVKILDMGLARQFESTEQLTEVLDKGAVVGTADYISPEQAMNSDELDIRADIYSLGATFFTIVTGRPPFSGNTAQKLLHHQIKVPPSLSVIDKTFPPGLTAVVAKMLQKKPSDRYANPAELIAALAPWVPSSAKVVEALSRTNLASSPHLQNTLNQVVASGTRRLTEVVVPKKSNKVLWAAVSGVALLVLIGGVLGIVAAVGGFSSGDSVQRTTGPAPAQSPTTSQPSAATTEKESPPTRAVRPPDTTAKVNPPISTPQFSAATGLLVYDLDLTGAKAFSERGKTVAPDVSKPNNLVWTPTAKTGPGQFPIGWQGRNFDVKSEAEYAVEVGDGGPAITMRGVSGPQSCMLFSPEGPFLSGTAAIKIEYQTDPSSTSSSSLKFKPTKPENVLAWEVARLPQTNGAWKTFEAEIPLKGSTAGFFEFHGPAKATAKLAIRKFTVRDAGPIPERVLYRLDLGKQKPFDEKAVRAKSNGAAVPVEVTDKSGSGTLPSQWYRWIEHADGVAEFSADATPAIGLRHVSGPPGVGLTTPQFTAPGRCRVRIVYATGSSTIEPILRVRPMSQGIAPWEAAKLPATGGNWRLAVIDVDLKSDKGGSFELLTTATGPDAAVRIREFAITDPMSPAQLAVQPVMQFDAKSFPEFKATIEQNKPAPPTLPRWPIGIGARVWKPGAVAELRCDVVDGSKALGTTNFNDEKSGQYSFEFEKDMGFKLEAGKKYLLRVSYYTKNDGEGHAEIQNYMFQRVARITLPKGPSGWRQGEVEFIRPSDSMTRLVIENNAVGEGNTLYFRSVEIFPVE